MDGLPRPLRPLLPSPFERGFSAVPANVNRAQALANRPSQPVILPVHRQNHVAATSLPVGTVLGASRVESAQPAPWAFPPTVQPSMLVTPGPVAGQSHATNWRGSTHLPISQYQINSLDRVARPLAPETQLAIPSCTALPPQVMVQSSLPQAVNTAIPSPNDDDETDCITVSRTPSVWAIENQPDIPPSAESRRSSMQKAAPNPGILQAGPTNTVSALPSMGKSKIVVLKLSPRRISDPTQPQEGGASPDARFTAGMIPTPPRSLDSSAENVTERRPQTPTKRKKTGTGPLPSGLYATRDRNSRRAATKAYRAPATPKKPRSYTKTPVQTPPPLAPSTAVKRKKGPSVAETRPSRKVRRISDGASATTPRRQSEESSAAATTQCEAPAKSVSLAVDLPGAVVIQQIRPIRDVEGDAQFVEDLCKVLTIRSKARKMDMGKRQDIRILNLLQLAEYPSEGEALFLSTEEAAQELQPGRFWNNIIVTTGQQALPLQSVAQFLGEYYEDDALVWIQDPAVKPSKNAPITRQVKMRQIKERLLMGQSSGKPWNLLELATHCEDGLRPAFLNTEDSRLLTKLKIPDAADHARRRIYEQGYKEIEKWALLAQAGALTEPHQDSHGYSTFITVNVGSVGFGWLSSPNVEERAAWCKKPSTFNGGKWRYIVLKPGQTVYFPAGTVHFVFRSPSGGNTLAFGGHILRCSNIVHWVNTLIEERDAKDITNEDLTDSATGYLERVEKFVLAAKVNGTMAKWGGEESVDEFLRLKKEFERKKQR